MQAPSRVADTAPLRLMSQAEAAEYLGISDRTIRAYIAAGTLRAHRIKGSRLIRLNADDVASLLCEIPTVGRESR
jgi:excisionase family DNA binding protein